MHIDCKPIREGLVCLIPLQFSYHNPISCYYALFANHNLTAKLEKVDEFVFLTLENVSGADTVLVKPMSTTAT